MLILYLRVAGTNTVPALWEIPAITLMAGLVAGLIARPRPPRGFAVGLIGGLSAVLALYVFVGFLSTLSGGPSTIPPDLARDLTTSSILVLVSSPIGVSLVLLLERS